MAPPTFSIAARAAGATRFVTQSIVFGYGYRDLGTRPLTEDDPFGIPQGNAFDEHLAAMVSTEKQGTTTPGIDGIALRYGLFYGADIQNMAAPSPQHPGHGCRRIEEAVAQCDPVPGVVVPCFSVDTMAARCWSTRCPADANGSHALGRRAGAEVAIAVAEDMVTNRVAPAARAASRRWAVPSIAGRSSPAGSA